MKIFLSKHLWYNNENIWVTGYVRTGNRHLTNDDLLDYFSGISTIAEFEQILKTANGQFSVVIETSDEIWAATDRLRNYPLFYTKFNSYYVISDDCYKLAEMQSENRFNANSPKCFLTSGYVLNNLTLIDDIFQIEAGEYVILGNTFLRNFYFDLNNVPIVEVDFNQAANELNGIISDVFRNHFQALSKDFIAIALSGGFDSRLIASMCAKYHPKNVICYTYGIRNNIEVAPAQEVAKQLGISWINIVYNSELINGFLEDETFNRYFPFASNLSSMFFLQEYFAVKYLKENKLVPDNCVFMSGMSGDMLAGSHLLPQMCNKMSRDGIASLIFKEFFRLVKISRKKKLNILKLIEEKIPQNKYETWKAFENWDQKERQAKFIVNSASVYSFFGYKYVLPLWDNLLSDYFSTLPFQLKLNKKLYDYVLKEYVFKEYNLNLKNEINPSTYRKTTQKFKEEFKSILPYEITKLFVKQQSPVMYDELTKAMLDELNPAKIIRPTQSNYYNSYITQWYLNKIHLQLNIKE
jgi:asparagine synthase (glutamine-hydrolysing)